MTSDSLGGRLRPPAQLSSALNVWRFLVAVLAAVLGVTTTAATSAAQTATTEASVRLIYPATVQKVDDLKFGSISGTSAGTVIIDADSGAITTTGGVWRSGGTAHAASFIGAARKRTVVNIRIPKAPILLQRTGGTETLAVSDWTLQGQDKRELAAQTTFNFRVGATLAVPANTVEGDYSGTFEVEIQYP